MNRNPPRPGGHPGYNWKPHFCCACGMLVGVNSEQFSPDFSLSQATMQWCNYFRGILVRPETPSPMYEVTEIGFFDVYLKGTNRDRMRSLQGRTLNTPEKISLECDCQLALPGAHPDSTITMHCFTIHSHCWDLLQRLIDSRLASEKLGLLLQSMRIVWREKFPLYPYGLQEHVEMDSGGRYCWIGHLLDRGISLLTACGGTMPSHATLAAPLRDPCHIPKLQALIRRCKNDRTRSRKASTAPTATRRSKRLDAAASNASPFYLRLPVDIMLLILDQLSSLMDAANAVDAFRWQLSDECWRRRLPLDEIHELDGVASDDMDWRHFFIEYGRLSEGSSQALANRMRIFAALRAIRDQFFKELNAENCQDSAEQLAC